MKILKLGVLLAGILLVPFLCRKCRERLPIENDENKRYDTADLLVPDPQ